MDDLVNRTSVIKAINNMVKECDSIYATSALRNLEAIVKDLPSAQSERQKGEWIDYTEDGYVECPFCHSATNCEGNKDELHFCFSCGADMREDGATNADVES